MAVTVELFDDIEGLPDNPDIAIELGNMVIAWAKAETVLSLLLSTVSGMSENMSIMGYYRIPTFEARTKFIRALITEWSTETHDKDAIFKEVEKLNGLAQARNSWIHGIWSKGKVTGQIVTFHLNKKDGDGRKKPVKASDIRQHNEAVKLRARTIMRLLKRRHGKVHTSDQTPVENIAKA